MRSRAPVLLTTCAGMFFLVAASGCGRQQDGGAGAERSATELQSDTALTATIQARLNGDSVVRRQDIDVKVEDQVATLSGTVENQIVEWHALYLARQVPGVVRVNDQLTVAHGER